MKVLYLDFFKRTITGRSEGSVASLECVNGWTLSGPKEQECYRKENGDLDWTESGRCGYSKL